MGIRPFSSIRGKPVRWACVSLLLVGGFFFYPTINRTARTVFAERALRERNGELALRWLDSIPEGTRDGQTHLLLAKTYRRLGRLDLVRDQLQTAWNLGFPVEQLQREQWLTLAQSGQMQEAEPHLRQLLQDPRGDGRDICECFVIGYLLHFQFPKAVPILAAWEAEFPNDARPHELQGSWFQDAERWSEAVVFYEKALKLIPGQTDIRRRMAVCLGELHKYDEAKEQFLQCLKEMPDDIQLLVDWSECLMLNGDLKESKSAIERALRLDSGNETARFAMAKTLLMEGAAGDAVESLQQLHRDNPADTEIQYSLASALQASGMTEQAAEMYRKVTAAEQKLRRKQELIDRLYQNQNPKPNEADVRYEIAMIAMNYESPVEGLRWLLSVIDLEPRHAPTHAALADYYQRIGKPELENKHRELAKASTETKNP